MALAEHSARLQEHALRSCSTASRLPWHLGIKEIIEYSGLTEVPMMPDCIRGVINLRGAVLPRWTCAVRFGKKSAK